jgi:hypothetical protein
LLYPEEEINDLLYPEEEINDLLYPEEEINDLLYPEESPGAGRARWQTTHVLLIQ